MQSCPCSIFDVREEQILDASGALRIRLVCNVCGVLIDSKEVERGDRTRVRPGESEQGGSMETSSSR